MLLSEGRSGRTFLSGGTQEEEEEEEEGEGEEEGEEGSAVIKSRLEHFLL